MTLVRVPATSANLGPGFDALGLALSLYNYYEYAAADGLEVSGCPAELAGEDNLFVLSYRRGLEALGLPFRGLRLSIRSDIPIARGLGSSAACIAGGLLAASLEGSRAGLEGSRAGLEGSRAEGRWGALGREGLLRLATEIEGHPDNVAPALLGGFCASVLEGGEVVAVRRALPAGPRFAALVPPFALSTAVARAALPKTLSYADAAYSAARAAVVGAAFASGDLAALARVLGSRSGADRLHEPWRAPLIPGFSEVRAAALKAGAAGVWLSGAGPTIMAMLSGEAPWASDFAGRMAPVLEERPEGVWRLLDLEADNEGATALDGGPDA